MRMTKNCPDDSVRVRQWRTFLTGATAPCIACTPILSYFALFVLFCLPSYFVLEHEQGDHLIVMRLMVVIIAKVQKYEQCQLQ